MRLPILQNHFGQYLSHGSYYGCWGNIKVTFSAANGSLPLLVRTTIRVTGTTASYTDTDVLSKI